MRLKETEADLGSWVEDILHQFGFRVAHFRPAKTEKGWKTAVSCDGQGFYDYFAIKPPRLMLVEIKSETGVIAPEQRVWLDLGTGLEIVETYLVRPSDRDEFQEILVLGHTPNLIERAMLKCAWVNLRELPVKEKV